MVNTGTLKDSSSVNVSGTLRYIKFISHIAAFFLLYELFIITKTEFEEKHNFLKFIFESVLSYNVQNFQVCLGTATNL
jgi:hypothetical protein